MKKYYILQVFALLFHVLTAHAQQGINYKAIISDSNGDVLTSTLVAVQFTILENGTTNVYQETHAPTTDGNGIIIVHIGEGNPTNGDFNTIAWGSNPHYLKTQIDSGNGLIDMGTTEFKAVPYALHSESATNVDDADADPFNEIQNLDNVLNNGNDAGAKRISNLADPADDQDAVTKSYIDHILFTLGLIPQNFAGFLSDIEGNEYLTVTIGTQTWMAKNLRTTKLNDGTDIPLVTDDFEWGNLTSPSYCWIDNSMDLGAIYGALYNWFVVETELLCPEGWHVPDLSDYTDLVDYLGGSYVAGGKLKEIGLDHWISPSNERTTNSSGFTALPGAHRYNYGGGFSNVGSAGFWWISDEYDSSSAYYWVLQSGNDDVITLDNDKQLGLSVRCIKD